AVPLWSRAGPTSPRRSRPRSRSSGRIHVARRRRRRRCARLRPAFASVASAARETLRPSLGETVSLHYSASRFLLGGLVGALSGWEVRGRENVPKTGGVIVASNHISFWDPPLVGTAAVRELPFLAKEALFRTPV